MKERDLSFDREFEKEIYAKDLISPIGTRRADFIIEWNLLVELKVLISLDDSHLPHALI